jgi:hypothetical protein
VRRRPSGGDHGGVDGADRDAADPGDLGFSLLARRSEGVVRSDLIRAQRAATLKQQHDALALETDRARDRRGRRRSGGLGWHLEPRSRHVRLLLEIAGERLCDTTSDHQQLVMRTGARRLIRGE